VRRALRELASDEWVIGLSAAIAIGYAAVSFARDLADTVVDAVTGNPGGLLAVELWGRTISFEALAGASATLVVVVGLYAVGLRYASTRGRREP
jgi:hypothetical protein